MPSVPATPSASATPVGFRFADMVEAGWQIARALPASVQWALAISGFVILAAILRRRRAGAVDSVSA